jgi:hypothetical protein
MTKPRPINLDILPHHVHAGANASKRAQERAKRLGEARVRHPRPKAPVAPFKAIGGPVADLAQALGYPPAVLPPLGRVHESPQDD